MKKYFIHNGTEQEGPFDIETLKEKKISISTPIWYEGLSEWSTVGKIDELKDLFKEVPPPFKSTATPPPINKSSKPKEVEKKTTSWRSIFIKTAVTFFIIIGILTVVNSLVSRNSSAPETYEEKVLTVEETEKANPTNFLEVTGTVHENFWGDKIKIKGSVINKATVANFKDIVLEVTFLSKTESVIKKEQYVLYDYVNAHSNKDFVLKVTNWKATHSVGCVAIGATSY